MHIGTTNTALTNDILPLIKKRWSPREFDPQKEISHEDLALLFEAARWTPSAYNEQPWNFIIVTQHEPELFEQMINLLKDENKPWAAKAFALVLTVASLKATHNDSDNFHALYDLGASVANLTLLATELNITVNQMGGFYREKAKEVFHLSENYSPVSVLALGYNSETESFEIHKKERALQRKRKSLGQFVFRNQWGNPFITVNDFQKN
jgi:nitroreductase